VTVAERGEVTGGRVQILAFVRRRSASRRFVRDFAPNFDQTTPPLAIVRDEVAISEMVDDSLARDIPKEG